jgi:hypothetical protein
MLGIWGIVPVSMKAVAELKRALSAAGVLVFRTRGSEVLLAERARDNLLLEAHVLVRVHEPDAESPHYTVVVSVRAQATDFPADDEPTRLDRARSLASSLEAAGFVVVTEGARPLHHPSDAEVLLDVSHEVVLERSASTLADAVEVALAALALPRLAVP